MKKTLLPCLLAVVGLLLCSRILDAQVRVTYIANEGFLLEGGGKKVLVDALFDGIDGYPRPDPETMKRLKAAEPPFDGVDLVVATHYHDDHMSPAPVLAHLRSNKRALFLSTPQAVKRLGLADDSPLGSRVVALYPEEGKAAFRDVSGIRLRILNLHHGRGRRPPVENLGFVIMMDGRRILHIGDTEANAADLAPYALVDAPIDVALLPAWFLTYPVFRLALETEIRPRRIGVMHLAEPSAPPPYFGPDRSYAERLRKIRAAYPAAVVFTRAGQVEEYP